MKQLLRYFCTLLLTIVCASTLWADDETITFSDLYSSNTVLDGTEIKGTNFSVTFQKRSGGTATQYYTNGSAVRWYGGGTMTISSSTKTIEKIEITFTQTANTISTDVGTYESGTWTGAANTVVFSQSGTSGQCRISSIKVTFAGGSGVSACAPPIFSPASGAYTSAQNVTITTTTSGATIYYTTDGSEPTSESTQYTNPITVSETTTIKAIAVKVGCTNSAVSTANYTIISLAHAGTAEDPYTVADARAAIDANAGVTGVYATGIVSQIVTAYNSQYGNISYNISADGTTTSDQLQAYRGKSFDGEWFTSEDDIKVGDVVVIYGNLKKYNSTYEFDIDNKLVSRDRPDIPVISFEPSSTSLFTYEEGYGPSESQLVEITVANAISNTVTVSLSTEGETYYELSNDDENFGSTQLTLELDAENSALFSVRLKAGLTASTDYDATLSVNAEGAVEKTINLSGYVSEVTPAAIYVSPVTSTVSQDAQTGSLELTTNRAEAWLIYYCPATAEGVDAPVTYTYSEGQSHYPWVTVELSENKDAVNYTIEANDGEERTVFFRIYGGDENENGVWSQLIKITQKAFVADYAVLPFEFSGGRSDIEGTAGLSHEGLDSDYTGANAQNTKLKFNSAGDYLLLKVNETIDSVSFDVKWNASNGDSFGTFEVQTSVDGETFATAYKIENGDLTVNTFESISFEVTDADVRYIKWVYTEKNKGNVGLGNIVVDALPVTVTVGALGLATFASDYALNFENVEGLEAYIVKEDEGLALQRVLFVPKNTGLLLRAKDITEATEFSIRRYSGTSVDDVTSNLLVRGTGVAVPSDAVGGGYNYVLSNNNNVVGFYRANNKVVATDKAYLHTATSASAGLFFDFNSTTGISTIGQINNLQLNGDAMYNLNGQRVNAPQRGIYIVNGKKVVIK